MFKVLSTVRYESGLSQREVKRFRQEVRACPRTPFCHCERSETGTRLRVISFSIVFEIASAKNASQRQYSDRPRNLETIEKNAIYFLLCKIFNV